MCVLRKETMKRRDYVTHTQIDVCVYACTHMYSCMGDSMSGRDYFSFRRRTQNVHTCKYISIHSCIYLNIHIFDAINVYACTYMLYTCKHVHTMLCKVSTSTGMGWLPLVGSLKLQVSFAKEPYKRDDILQTRCIILRSLLIVVTPFSGQSIYIYIPAYLFQQR